MLSSDTVFFVYSLLQVWLCVKALTLLGQHKAAKKLTYGELSWCALARKEIQKSHIS